MRSLLGVAFVRLGPRRCAPQWHRRLAPRIFAAADYGGTAPDDGARDGDEVGAHRHEQQNAEITRNFSNNEPPCLSPVPVSLYISLTPFSNGRNITFYVRNLVICKREENEMAGTGTKLCSKTLIKMKHGSGVCTKWCGV